jgi:hypothetical protein
MAEEIAFASRDVDAARDLQGGQANIESFAIDNNGGLL